MTNENVKKLGILVGGVLLFLFLGLFMISQQKTVSTTSDIEFQESEEFEPRMAKVEYDIAQAVEDNFNELRQYISNTDMLYISSKKSGFTDGLKQRDLELLKAFEQKGYTIDGTTLFVPFEYSDGVIFYGFDLKKEVFGDHVSVIAGYDVETEQLFSLEYDTDINEVD